MDAKKKRIERKKKLKRIFNYDGEMSFLEKFWEIKKGGCTIDEFKKIVQDTLVYTEQISAVVYEYFIEELRIKEKINEKKDLLKNVDEKRQQLSKEIKDLEDSLNDDEDDYSPTFGDPCSRTTRQRSGC